MDSGSIGLVQLPDLIRPHQESPGGGARHRRDGGAQSPRSYRGSVISPHVRNLRDKVGHDLLLLPSTSVLPRDDAGRLLLVRQIDTGNWATIGGAVEPGESPRDGAVRETEEEAGITVELGNILGVFGGPEYRVIYPNGDESAYVVTVFDATVLEGTPRPDGDETSEVGWFRPEELPLDQMGGLTRALFRDLGLSGLDSVPPTARSAGHRPGGRPAPRGYPWTMQ